MSFRCDRGFRELKGDVSLEIYRIIQEALTTTLRHSDGTQAWVKVERQGQSTLCLTIKDNGKGMLQSATHPGFGRLGMRERVASLKGQFQLINCLGQGLEIRITLPLRKPRDD